MYDAINPMNFLDDTFSETPPLNERFDAIGYGSLNYFDALGSLTSFIVLAAILQIIGELLSFIAEKTKHFFNPKSLVFKLLYRKIMSLDIFNQTRYSVVDTWVRVLLEGFVELGLASVLALYAPNFIELPNSYDSLCYEISVVTLAILIVFFVFAILFTTIIIRPEIQKQKAEIKKERIVNLEEFMKSVVTGKEELEKVFKDAES